MPPVVILCGGRGTRLRERTESVPKALVEIGGRPILWHVIQIYAAQGFERFLLATGYLGEAVAEFAAAERWPKGSRSSASTPGSTPRPAGRIALLGERLGGGTLLRHLRRRRRRRRPRRPARVPPRARRSGDDDRGPPEPAVGRRRARRRPGRRVRREAALRALDQRRLPSASSRRCCRGSGTRACSSASRCSGLAAAGELRAFRHEGFWDCMDTYKDAVVLDDLWTCRPGAVEGLGRGGGAMKRALVTGGHGFVASNLAGRCSSAATRSR